MTEQIRCRLFQFSLDHMTEQTKIPMQRIKKNRNMEPKSREWTTNNVGEAQNALTMHKSTQMVHFAYLGTKSLNKVISYPHWLRQR